MIDPSKSKRHFLTSGLQPSKSAAQGLRRCSGESCDPRLQAAATSALRTARSITGSKLKKSKIRVLFLCTGNSCRSQIAEGWARHLKGDCIEAFSAGAHPCGLHPKAIRVMGEAGVDISGQRSKHVGEFRGQEFDYVVTLCGGAREMCPVFPGKTKVIHRGFDDPAAGGGIEDEVLERFRRVRDEIRRFVAGLPEGLARLEGK